MGLQRAHFREHWLLLLSDLLYALVLMLIIKKHPQTRVGVRTLCPLTAACCGGQASLAGGVETSG